MYQHIYYVNCLVRSDINPLQGSSEGMLYNFTVYVEMLALSSYPLGRVRLYEVSGQNSSEAALLQLKKPDEKLANMCVM